MFSVLNSYASLLMDLGSNYAKRKSGKHQVKTFLKVLREKIPISLDFGDCRVRKMSLKFRGVSSPLRWGKVIK